MLLKEAMALARPLAAAGVASRDRAVSLGCSRLIMPDRCSKKLRLSLGRGMPNCDPEESRPREGKALVRAEESLPTRSEIMRERLG